MAPFIAHTPKIYSVISEYTLRPIYRPILLQYFPIFSTYSPDILSRIFPRAEIYTIPNLPSIYGPLYCEPMKKCIVIL